MTHSIIGIDIASKTLQISQRKGVEQIDQSIENTLESIKAFVAPMDLTTHFIFEATGVYSRKLEFVLSEKGFPFSKINPTKIKGFSRALGKLAKTDKEDARNIRLYGEKINPPTDKPLKVERIKQARLRQVYTKLTKMLRDIENQIHTLAQEPLGFERLHSAFDSIKE